MAPYDGGDDFGEEEDDILVEEERIGAAGLDKALTQLATQVEEPNEESSMDVGNYEDSNLEINYHHSFLSSEVDKYDLLSDDDCSDAQLKEGRSILEETSIKTDLGFQIYHRPGRTFFACNDAGCFIVQGYNSMPQSMTEELVDEKAHVVETSYQ